MSDDPIWSRLEAAFRAGDPISGTVQRVSGGFFEVDLGGVVAGMPLSHAGWRVPSDPGKLVGQTLELKLTALTPARGNAIVSRLALLQDRRARTLQTLAVGAVVEATVKALAPFGAFVDLGEVDAMLHRTELSDARPLPEPEDLLKPGDRVRVRVLELGATIQVSLRGVS